MNEKFFRPLPTAEMTLILGDRGKTLLHPEGHAWHHFDRYTRVPGMRRWAYNRITRRYLDSFNRTKMKMSKSHRDIAKVVLPLLLILLSFYCRLIKLIRESAWWIVMWTRSDMTFLNSTRQKSAESESRKKIRFLYFNLILFFCISNFLIRIF